MLDHGPLPPLIRAKLRFSLEPRAGSSRAASATERTRELGNRKVSLPREGRSVNAEIAARGRRSSYSSRGRIVNERICDVYRILFACVHVDESENVFRFGIGEVRLLGSVRKLQFYILEL